MMGFVNGEKGDWLMDDLISRQAAIDAVNEYLRLSEVSKTVQNMTSIQAILRWLPSAEPHNFDEWCEDCKEYDQEKNCCPRFNRVIRTAMEEAKGDGNG